MFLEKKIGRLVLWLHKKFEKPVGNKKITATAQTSPSFGCRYPRNSPDRIAGLINPLYHPLEILSRLSRERISLMTEKEKHEYLRITEGVTTLIIEQTEAELNELIKKIPSTSLKMEIDTKIGELILEYQYFAYKIGKNRKRRWFK